MKHETFNWPHSPPAAHNMGSPNSTVQVSTPNFVTPDTRSQMGTPPAPFKSQRHLTTVSEEMQRTLDFEDIEDDDNFLMTDQYDPALIEQTTFNFELIKQAQMIHDEEIKMQTGDDDQDSDPSREATSTREPITGIRPYQPSLAVKQTPISNITGSATVVMQESNQFTNSHSNTEGIDPEIAYLEKSSLIKLLKETEAREARLSQVEQSLQEEREAKGLLEVERDEWKREALSASNKLHPQLKCTLADYERIVKTLKAELHSEAFLNPSFKTNLEDAGVLTMDTSASEMLDKLLEIRANTDAQSRPDTVIRQPTPSDDDLDNPEDALFDSNPEPKGKFMSPDQA